MIEEHDVCDQGEAFEVEFLAFSGETVAIATAAAAQVRPIGQRDIPHTRSLP